MYRKKTNRKIRTAERKALIILSAARAIGYTSSAELASVMGMDYQAFMRRLAGKTAFRIDEVDKLREILALGAEECAALCGDPKPCRYEAGYTPAESSNPSHNK